MVFNSVTVLAVGCFHLVGYIWFPVRFDSGTWSSSMFCCDKYFVYASYLSTFPAVNGRGKGLTSGCRGLQ